MTEAECVERAAKILYAAKHGRLSPDPEYATVDECLSELTPRYGPTVRFVNGEATWLAPVASHVELYHRMVRDVESVVEDMPAADPDNLCPRCGVNELKPRRKFCSRECAYEGRRLPRTLSADDVRAIRRRAAEGAITEVLATEYDTSVSNIWMIVNRRTWRHVA